MRPSKLLPEMLVPCEVKNMPTEGLVWADSAFIAAQSSDAAVVDKRQKITDDWSIGIDGSPCFEGVDFIGGTEQKVFGERYGGFGTAKNGGGVRCVNRGDVQAKGIGVNPLIGRDALEGYCTGSLNLLEGVTETVFSRVLNRVFPLGAAKIYGLIATGPKMSTYKNADVEKFANGVDCWGAILLREACVRPAHFFRTIDYQRHPNYKHQLMSDVARVRRVNREFRKSCGDDKGFLGVLGQFIKNHANQFAFARVARFAHGAATASNLTLDGRWLDLPISSFLPGNRNYRLSLNQLPFFSEHKVLDPTIVELAYTYGKYNEVHIDPNPLIEYYHRLYRYYLHRHCGWVLGVSSDAWPKPGQSAGADDFVEILLDMLDDNKRMIWNSPYVLESYDPVSQLLTYLFSEGGQLYPVDTVLPKRIQAMLDERLPANKGLELVSSFFLGSANAAAETVATAIRALKRTLLSSLFYSGRVRSHLESLIDAEDISVYEEFIERCDRQADWIFEDDGNLVYLYRSSDACLAWSVNEAMFVVASSDGVLQKCSSASQWLQSKPKHIFCVDGYDFFPVVLKILSAAEAITVVKSQPYEACSSFAASR